MQPPTTPCWQPCIRTELVQTISVEIVRTHQPLQRTQSTPVPESTAPPADLLLTQRVLNRLSKDTTTKYENYVR